jgi:hypothetical protein
MDIEYRIDKNKLIDKFNSFVDKNSSSNDTYNSKGKEVQYRTDYTVLEKIKAIYRFVVNNIKMDLRREFIHDDDKFYEALNLLNDRVNNKIRSKTDGSLYVLVGLDKPIVFSGDDDQYQQYVYLKKSKQQQLIRKIVEELNSVLENNANEEENRSIINDDDLPDPPKVLTAEAAAEQILSNIPEDEIVELHKGNFEAFDKSFSIFISESTIDPKMGEKLLERLHSVYQYNKIFWDTIKEADDDADRKLTNTDQMKDKQDTAGNDKPDTSEPKSGIDQRREQSRETLQKRGLKPAGGVWQDSKGMSVAKIDDNGNVEPIVADEAGGDSGSAAGLVGQYQSQQQEQPQAAAGGETEEEPEVETGLEDDELEKLRTTFDDEIEDEAK